MVKAAEGRTNEEEEQEEAGKEPPMDGVGQRSTSSSVHSVSLTKISACLLL